jgi:hypothetical protein
MLSLSKSGKTLVLNWQFSGQKLCLIQRAHIRPNENPAELAENPGLPSLCCSQERALKGSLRGNHLEKPAFLTELPGEK